MARFFNSGLYAVSFYTKYDNLDLYSSDDAWVEYNRDLYIKNKDLDEEQLEDLDCLFYESLAYWTTYFEPLIFDEEVAYECDLVPFSFEDKNLLALGGCGMDLSPKLDAYQVLTHGSIDKHSRFFKHEDYFKYVVSDTVYRKVKKILKELQQ